MSVSLIHPFLQLIPRKISNGSDSASQSLQNVFSLSVFSFPICSVFYYQINCYTTLMLNNQHHISVHCKFHASGSCTLVSPQWDFNLHFSALEVFTFRDMGQSNCKQSFGVHFHSTAFPHVNTYIMEKIKYSPLQILFQPSKTIHIFINFSRLFFTFGKSLFAIMILCSLINYLLKCHHFSMETFLIF